MTDRILLVIPAYRCAPQIGRTLAQLTPELAAHFARILVIDNRSPDETLSAAMAAASGLPVSVARNPRNVGLGGTHKVAIGMAMAEGFSHVAILHGDDQASLEDLTRELAAGRHHAAPLLLGARFHPDSRLIGYDRKRVWGNLLFNRLFGYIAGRPIQDLGSGLNLMATSIFADGAYLRWPDNLTWNYHLVLWAADAGHAWRFFPISWREEDQRSNVAIVRQSLAMIMLLARRAWHGRGWLQRCGSPPAHAYTTEIVWA